MRVIVSSTGDFEKTREWIARVVNKSPTGTLRHIAGDGEAALAAGTPRDTGATAGGWNSEIISTGKNSEVSWMNNAHPGESVNVAKIIDLGHGTGTGGYVPPNPYIKKSMDSVWDTTGTRIVEELMK